MINNDKRQKSLALKRQLDQQIKCMTDKKSLNRLEKMDLDEFKMLANQGHRVCKLLVLKKFDIIYRRIWLNTQTQQIVLSKWNASEFNGSTTAGFAFASIINTGRTQSANGSISSNCPDPSISSSKTHTLDLRLIKYVQVFSQMGSTMQIAEKWRRDGALQRFDPDMVMCITWGSTFILNSWLILFDNKSACELWSEGLQKLCAELVNIPHALVVEQWLRKQFYSLLPHPTDSGCITIKHMKPFVQHRLQCKVSSKQLQEITEGEMGFEGFVLAHNRLLDFNSLFKSNFAEYADHQFPQRVPFNQFMEFLRDKQHDNFGQSKELVSNFLRQYLRDVDPERDMPEPWLTTEEFIDYLYSPENSLFDPVNKEIVHDMTKPLTHYWISSSHNTYLTGDQLKSESSLDSYARALLMGCRCIELDCWDGPQRKTVDGEIQTDIVIYHGYTMTSKLALRDVLQTIKRFAFQTSSYPVILSIEDNCSVTAQRQMAIDIQEVLGDLLLTAPVNRDEWELPSPADLRHKIILKHKKLQMQQQPSDSVTNMGSGGAHGSVNFMGDDLEQDILSRSCIKKGVLWLRKGNSTTDCLSPTVTTGDWFKHIFVLFNDRLCYLIQPLEDKHGNSTFSIHNGEHLSKPMARREDSLSSQDDSLIEESSSSSNLSNTSVVDACMNAHIMEEWFHGKIDRDEAKLRLMKCTNTLDAGCSSDGLFLVRESSTFIGDFTLSFMHNGNVHHCRIKTSVLSGGERKYHLLETVKRDTLYELISYYTKHPLDTPNFKAYLQIPCPQPEPHIDQPWFATTNTQRAEELLNTVNQDGAFLIRYSTSDKNVFVLSMRVDGKLWHYRLKREGRIFVVNDHIFENLCQMVEYYGQNQFVRGVCFKYPVNEKNIDLLASSQIMSSKNGELKSFSIEPFTSAGYYMDLKDFEKEEVQAEAIEAFETGDDMVKLLSQSNQQLQLIPNNILRFPIGARITVLQKGANSTNFGKIEKTTSNCGNTDKTHESPSSSIWLGRYNNEVGWFPAHYVREITASTALFNSDFNFAGDVNEMNYGTIELVGTAFERVEIDRPHTCRISLAQNHWNVQEYFVAADSKEEFEEWLNTCKYQAQLANDKIHQLRNKEKQLRIANELSSLVIYCQAVPFDPDFELQDPRQSFYEMCSISECRYEKVLDRGLALFNQRQLCRIYPHGCRVTSTNFNPLPMWNTGCHMVALNFQTGDKAMQLNAGRFLANGRCGYVLKPQYLMDETFRKESIHIDKSQQTTTISATNDDRTSISSLRRNICRRCRRSTPNLVSPASFSTITSNTTTTMPSRHFSITSVPFANITRDTSNDTDKAQQTNFDKTASKSKKSLEKSNNLLLEEDIFRQDEKVADDSSCCHCDCTAYSTASTSENAQQENEIMMFRQNNNTSTVSVSTLLNSKNHPIMLDIVLISGRHLSRKIGYDKSGICSPYVEIEVLGFEHDCQIQRTNTITSNGLNPIWQEHFHFFIQHPEICLLRFYVEDGDFVGPKTDPFIGQCTLPLDCVRPGYRSVPLTNQFNEPLELSALLVYVEIRLCDSSNVYGKFSSPSIATSCISTGTPIYNVHQMLQSGRSVQRQAPTLVERIASVDSRVSQPIPNANTSLTTQSTINSNILSFSAGTSRSTSVESAETNNSSAYMLPQNKRGMSTNTLRRIFRLGRHD